MDILEMVKVRLAAIGYTVQDNDIPLIEYMTQSTAQYIKNFCNVDKVPEELTYKWVDAVCGEFLYQKKSIGALNEDFDFSGAVSQISEGDVSVSYNGTSSPEEQFNTLIDGIRTVDISSMLRFRKLVW